MNEDIARFDQIQDYLHNRMSVEERKSFEERLATDAALAEELAIHRLEQEMMNIMLEDDLNDQLQSWQQEKEEQGRIKRKNRNRRLWSLVLIFLFLFILLVFLWSRKDQAFSEPSENGFPQDPIHQEDIPLPALPSQEAPATGKEEPRADIQSKEARQALRADALALVEEFGPAPEFVGTVLRSAEASPGRLDSALLAIRTSRYEEAAALLEPLTKDADEEVALNAQLNLGYLFFLKKEYSRAASYLEKTASSPDYLYIEPAEWYLGLCYLALGRRAERNRVLEKIIADPGHAFFRQAQSLKTRLKDN